MKSLELLKQQVASETRAVASGSRRNPQLEKAVRELSSFLRDQGRLPEQVLIEVKDAVFCASVGPFVCDDAVIDGHLTRDITARTVTWAIETYYAPAAPVIATRNAAANSG